MLARIGAYEYDLEQGFAICIPFHQRPDQVNCYYAPPFSVSPVVMGDFTGEISSGAPVNYRNISVNPHGNGTHTECLAHISDADLDVHAALTDSFFPVQVLTIAPHRLTNGDQVLRFREAEILPEIKALAIRSLPNTSDKQHRAYSGTNPPYLDAACVALLPDLGIDHLLIDLPSVDKEEDGGALAAHKAFWNFASVKRTHATITELIFIPDHIKDGRYLLNLQIAPFRTDASPSRPILFPLQKNNHR